MAITLFLPFPYLANEAYAAKISIGKRIGMHGCASDSFKSIVSMHAQLTASTQSGEDGHGRRRHGGLPGAGSDVA